MKQQSKGEDAVIYGPVDQRSIGVVVGLSAESSNAASPIIERIVSLVEEVGPEVEAERLFSYRELYKKSAKVRMGYLIAYAGATASSVFIGAETVIPGLVWGSASAWNLGRAQQERRIWKAISAELPARLGVAEGQTYGGMLAQSVRDTFASQSP